MRPTFHAKTLAVAVAAFSITNIASAAGLDRSGQDITAFLQDGLYAEAVYTYIDADVSGYENSASTAIDKNAYQQGNKIGDIAESYDFFRYGVKADINDTFSVGVLYDEPFGAAADYSGDNKFVDQNPLSSRNGEGANHTRKRLPVVLVYYEEYQNIAEAFYREKQVQGWSRKKKEALINTCHGDLPILSKNYTQFPPDV